MGRSKGRLFASGDGARASRLARIRAGRACRIGFAITILALALSQVVETAPASATGTTVTFSYTGAQQSWTVPSGVTSIQVDVRGAQGGGGYGGLGARVLATLSVTPSQTLYINVGAKGSWNAAAAGSTAAEVPTSMPGAGVVRPIFAPVAPPFRIV